MVVGLRPVAVQVTDTPYKPAVLVGGNTALSDESDATYADQWLSVRGGVSNGPTMIAGFDPAEVVPLDDWFRLRFEVFNDTGATGTAFVCFMYSLGSEVGTFQRGGSFTIEAPATNTIYDWADGWTLVQSGSVSVADAFAAGFEIRLRRLNTTSASDGDWGLRVYEIVASGEGEVTPPPTTLTVVRQYPRDDGLGLSSAPRLYPASKARRLVGGYQ